MLSMFILVEKPEEDIWQTNPGLVLVKEFRELKEKLGDEKAGNLLKGIYYLYDTKSELRKSGTPLDKMMGDIEETLLWKDFKWFEYEWLVEYYKENCLTKLESLFRKYEGEIEDLSKFLGEWKWAKNNVKNRAMAVAQYKYLFEQYTDVAGKVRMETEANAELHSGYQKSFLEKMN